MQGKGALVNRVELECQVLCAALRQSFLRKDKVGTFTSIRELSHLFPDLLPPPEDRSGNNKVDYYESIGIRPQSGINNISVGYLRTVKKFLKEHHAKESKAAFNTILNAGFVLRKPRLRLSHDLVIARRWLYDASEPVLEPQDTQPRIPLTEEILRPVMQPPPAPAAVSPSAAVSVRPQDQPGQSTEAPARETPLPTPAAGQFTYETPLEVQAATPSADQPHEVTSHLEPAYGPAAESSYSHELQTADVAPPDLPFQAHPTYEAPSEVAYQASGVPSAGEAAVAADELASSEVSYHSGDAASAVGFESQAQPAFESAPEVALQASTSGGYESPAAQFGTNYELDFDTAESGESVSPSLPPVPELPYGEDGQPSWVIPPAYEVSPEPDAARAHEDQPTPPTAEPAVRAALEAASPAGSEPAEAAFVFDESQLRKPEADVEVPEVIRLMEAAHLITSLEVQALKAQMQLAPNIPAEQFIMSAGYASKQEISSLNLALELLSKKVITMAQFQVAMYDERTSGLRMAESLQVRGWLETEVKNPLEN